MQIEAGKYYKTRDGRKVGPMIYDPYVGFSSWEARMMSDLWNDSGESDTGDNDLIAEWTDEHETPHFTQLLSNIQTLAQNHGCTIDAVSASGGAMTVDVVRLCNE